MASTNKTTNYELSQYIGTDKPTYLTDYNQDMSKIDAGIHAAKSEADTNADSIGTLSSLTTTAKTSCVAAINEIDGEVTTNTNNIATNTSNIATNTTHIGTVANLTTASKTDLVVAANEINAKVGNTSNLNTSDKTSTVGAINEVNYNLGLLNLSTIEPVNNNNITTSKGSIASGYTALTVAKNSNGTIAKIYGNIIISISSSQADTPVTISFPTSLRPTSNITINSLGISSQAYGGYNNSTNGCDISIATDGTVTISGYHNSGYTNLNITLHPCLLFIKDFGDEPIPPAPTS